MGQILTVLICATSLITAQTIRLPYDLSVEPVSDYTKSGDSSLAKPLLSYFAIPYAEPPVGTLRFQPPVGPKRGNGQLLKNLDFGKICLQDGPKEIQSEDCLTLSVFKPQSHDNTKHLPVLIWTHGGAFNSGSGGENGILASMIGNSPHDFIGVTFNYRLGALGFLPSQLTHEAGLLNLGLQDQRMAYEWVQKYIGLFGGDPDKVTIWGESAGAHSCGAHLQHTESDTNSKPPFNQMILNSGGPSAAVKTDWTHGLYNEQMAEFLERTGCTGEVAVKAFDCLREVDAEKIRDASSAIFNKYKSPPRWPFQPVIDGKYIQQSPTKSWAEELYNKGVSVITGFNTDEGSMFVPKDTQSNKEFRAFWQTILPGASSELLDTIEKLYPDPVSEPDSPYRGNSKLGEQFRRLSAAFGDYVYASTVKQTAQSMANGGSKVWKYHFDFASKPNEEAPMVEHASELAYFSKQRSESIGKVMNDYYTSFIVSGDPNANVPLEYPEWPQYDLRKPEQMTFATGPKVNPDDLRKDEIDFWMYIAAKEPL